MLQIMSYIEGHMTASMELQNYNKSGALDYAISSVKSNPQYNGLMWKSALNIVLK